MSWSVQPSFDQWVQYAFTKAVDDFWERSGDVEDVVRFREASFLDLDPVCVTEYLTRLFESPAFIADRYSNDQIADATSFLFGIGSEYFLEVQSNAVPADLQARCIRSVTRLYTDLYDRVCGQRGTDPDSDLRETCKVDGAVYMIWDMNYLECTVMFPERNRHLVEPGIEVLETVLRRCRTSACRVSALHGIGHIRCAHEYGGDGTIVERLKGIVDEFVRVRDLPDWLREYAACARDGGVQ